MGAICQPEIETSAGVMSFESASFIDSHTAKELQPRIAEIIQGIWDQLTLLFIQQLNCTTLEEFIASRKERFLSYSRLSFALSQVLAATTSPEEHMRVIQESVVAAEEEFKTIGAAYLGDDAYQEVMFCLSTLKSTYRWIPYVLSVKPQAEKEDMELARQFTLSMHWCEFHLSCLALGIERKITIQPEILQALLEGCRIVVMSYAYIRQAIDLRGINAQRYGENPHTTWDDEDQALANAH